MGNIPSRHQRDDIPTTTMFYDAMSANFPISPRYQGLPPVWRADARVLLLGSFPGRASLAASAYYAHPRNQFWPIMGDLIGIALIDEPYAARLQHLQEHRLALWDTVNHCQREGSLDSAIRQAQANHFEPLLARLPDLKLVAFNGQHAARQQPYFAGKGYDTVRLPSTSPAYAALSAAEKSRRWRAAIQPYLQDPAGGTP